MNLAECPGVEPGEPFEALLISNQLHYHPARTPWVWWILALAAGFEPAASRFEVWHSIQLSYASILAERARFELAGRLHVRRLSKTVP